MSDAQREYNSPACFLHELEAKSAAGAADIRLRDVTADDLPVLYRHEVDPESNRMAGLIPREADAFKAHWTKALGDPAVVAKVILADGVVAGVISCFDADGEYSVGYRIGREYWGRHVATRALELILEVAIRRPLHALVAAHNKASIRVLERAGFTITGYRWCPGTERLVACDEAMLILR